MRIHHTNRFLKKLEKSPIKIQEAFKQKLRLFINDKNNPLLNNHKLAGQLNWYRSINITADWRALFREDKDIIYFITIGTHSNLYK
ncbi:hypothetical protein COT99_01155 [Candidatus Falkowbacteria bacterium CG10_big_fil_rev_8_21_14_0_10_43_10]|uniref:Type II toxin-antitoxin system mRNA interferase toxin, RelE/StbE family n=1 Tax=Candidatus Falkowbacteria bacterium CG10_big_fil_rev_8_21_14_0_10_43_10 TaxID=1974567 RepID=A0A2H0V2N6_9BACT|nr:MAG: hypothetical protein COT99_01155 [Candidatus Falkowbacteria bacterium CG10_big_fil_rev_8_21_14_0_10_43_10]